jgi:hypothetical protein
MCDKVLTENTMPDDKFCTRMVSKQRQNGFGTGSVFWAEIHFLHGVLEMKHHRAGQVFCSRRANPHRQALFHSGIKVKINASDTVCSRQFRAASNNHLLTNHFASATRFSGFNPA